jgi:hypothetical protein
MLGVSVSLAGANGGLSQLQLSLTPQRHNTPGPTSQCTRLGPLSCGQGNTSRQNQVLDASRVGADAAADGRAHAQSSVRLAARSQYRMKPAPLPLSIESRRQVSSVCHAACHSPHQAGARVLSATGA